MVKEGYKMTEVGGIPVDWELVKFSKFVSHIRGGASLKPTDFISGGVPVLPKSGVGWGGLLVVEKKNQKYVSSDYASRFERSCVDSGFTIIVLRDLVPSGPNIGLCVRITDDQTYVLAQGVYGMILDDRIIIPKYLIQYSNSYEYRKLMQSILVGSTQVHIRNTTLKNTSLPLPPTLAEQTAIATALIDADGLIRGLEAVIAKKRAIKEGVRGELLRPKAGWEVSLIGDFAQVSTGGTPSRIVESYWGEGHRWMNSGELNLKLVYEVEGRITDEGLSNSATKYIPEHCVLIGLAGQGKTRGTAAMNFVSVCTNQSIAAIHPCDKFDKYFLYYFIDSKYENLRELSDGGGGRGGLNLSIIKAIEVQHPSLEQQKEIGVNIAAIDAELTTLTTKLAKARQLKSGMMGELLTGKVRLV